MRLFAFCAFAFLAGTQIAAGAPACPAPHAMHFEVEGHFRRDVLGFTEGLEVRDHDLYESTGAPDGGTRLMRITPGGKVTVLNDSGTRFFGEGLTIFDGRIYQLSWRDHKVFVYDLGGKLLRTMTNPHEGWGLTHDKTRLIFGDGSDKLYFADPLSFATTGSVTVRRGPDAVDNINELEYVDGGLYANVWQTREILRISPASGCVEAVANMDTLWAHMSEAERNYTGIDADFVLNGIAYDPTLKLFYVTGKEWPMVFAGRFIDN